MALGESNDSSGVVTRRQGREIIKKVKSFFFIEHQIEHVILLRAVFRHYFQFSIRDWVRVSLQWRNVTLTKCHRKEISCDEINYDEMSSNEILQPRENLTPFIPTWRDVLAKSC